MLHRRLPIAIAAFACACGEGTDPINNPPPPGPALEIVTTMLPAGKLGLAYDQKIAVKGGTTPYTFSISAGEAPRGLELKAETGQLTGIPVVPGTAAFTLQVKDKAGATKTQALTIYIEPDPLEIVTRTVPDGFEGDAYTVMLSGRGGVAPLVWTVDSGTLPAGLTLSQAGELAGTPTEAGGFDFTVKLADTEMTSVTQMLHLFVESKTPMITTATLARGGQNVMYEEIFEADGGKPPYTWSLAAGALPRGVGIDAQGHLAGTPTESGLFRFTVAVADSATETDQKDFTLSILAPLVISTPSLPIVLLNRPVQFDVRATGGLPPYTWFISGALPTGLTFSSAGRLEGTTAQAGEFPITLRVQDSLGGAPRSRMYTLRVSDEIVFEASPMTTIPAVCTSTRVSYTWVPITISDSLVIDEMTVTVDVEYRDGDPNDQRGALRLALWAPDGRKSVLCGNSAGVRAESGCTLATVGGRTGVFTTFNASTGGPSAPDVPLSVFRGMNAQGEWRFEATTARPTTDAAGACRQSGLIVNVRMTVRDDRSPDPYVLVNGYTRNNLVIVPWVRITGGGVPAEDEMFMSATLWTVGPNNIREAGLGDDVPDPRAFTWSGAGLPLGTTISPDGHVVAGGCPGVGRCDGDEGTITASDGLGNQVTMRLLVIPPDWNRASREF